MNDECVVICCKDVADEFNFPPEVVVIADCVDPHISYIISREEFINFLEENAAIMRRDPS